MQTFTFSVSFALQLIATLINIAVGSSALFFDNAASLTLVAVSALVAIGAGVVASLGGLHVWPALLTAIGGPVLVAGVFQLTFSFDCDSRECGAPGGSDVLAGDIFGGLVLLAVVVSGSVATVWPRHRVAERPSG